MCSLPSQPKPVSTNAGACLLALARLGVDLRQQLRDLALLHQRVDVQHRLVARREDGLVLQQVEDLGARSEASVAGASKQHKQAYGAAPRGVYQACLNLHCRPDICFVQLLVSTD